MAVPAQAPVIERSKAPGTAVMLTVIITLLAVVASLGGLFLPGLYRDSQYMINQAVGQDLVTLVVAAPALIITLFYVRRGSPRATLAWVGLLGYILYTYTTYAFGSAFNRFFLIYVALFSLTIFTLVAVVSQIDTSAWAGRFDSGTPRRAVAAFLGFIGLMVTGLWLPEILRYLATGKLPETLVQAQIPTNFVYVMDLGLVVPLAFLSAVWLWQRRPWGYLLAGAVLTKATTMGLALLSMVWFMVRGGDALEVAPAAMAAIVATGGLGFTVWFMRHCHD